MLVKANSSECHGPSWFAVRLISFRHRHYHLSSLVLNEEHDELCRLGTACIPTDDMNIVRAFIKGLAWCQSHFLSTFHLHDDRTLQHIDECMGIVPVDRIHAARRVFHCDHQDFL